MNTIELLLLVSVPLVEVFFMSSLFQGIANGDEKEQEEREETYRHRESA